MKSPTSLTIFFPAYNEEANIRETVLGGIKFASENPDIRDYEVIVVNDGSSDDTKTIVEELAATYPQVRLINHPQNRGYGASLKSGIAAATMEYVFFTDADLQFDISELKNFLAHVPEYSLIIGYRAPRRDPFMRLVNAWGWNKLNRFLFGLRVRDIDCAFKLFKRSEVQSLQLESEGAMISAEMLIRLTRSGINAKEIAVTHLPRKAGSPTGAKLSVILRAFGEMIRLYRGDLGPLTHKQAIKFMTVGLLNTFLDVVAYIYFTRGTTLFADHLLAAKFISFLIGTASSLICNRYWTFGARTRLTWAEVARFYSMTSVSLVVNVLVLGLLVNFGVYDLIALGITTIFTFLVGFTLSKLWVFKNVSIKKP